MSDKEKTSKPYRPSNGIEGYIFEEEFCCRCRHYKKVDTETWDCDMNILNLASLHSVDDPHYPTEWVHDEDGNPTCTAFEEKEEE